jgi:hypothetical protein
MFFSMSDVRQGGLVMSATVAIWEPLQVFRLRLQSGMLIKHAWELDSSLRKINKA